MATLPFVFEGIVNDTAELEILRQWYYKVYTQQYRWEKMFGWKEATQYNLMFRRKHPTIYQTSTGATIFNGMSKLLSYTGMTYQEEFISLDSQFTFARQISPTEREFINGLLRTDMEQGIEAELNFRRQKIMETLQKPNAISQFVMPAFTDQDTFLTAYDNLLKAADLINLKPRVILASVDFFNAAKRYLKLQVYSDKQVNDFVDTPYYPDQITDIQGIKIWRVVEEYEYNAPDGTVQTLKLMNDNTHAIIMEDGTPEKWISLRVKTHTPLRAAEAGVGIGTGRTIFVEWVKNYGAGIKEPKKFLIAETAIVKKSLSDARSNIKVRLNDPIVLADFENAVVTSLTTNQAMFNLTLADVDFFQADGTTPLVLADLSFATVSIVVKAKAGSVYFKDSKPLYVQIEKSA